MKFILSLILFTVSSFTSFSQSKQEKMEDLRKQASTLSDEGNYKQALTLIEQALEIDPLSSDFNVYRGDILLEMEDPGKAFLAYRKAIELNQENGMAHNNIALILTNAGEFQLAEEEYSLAIEYAESDTLSAMYHGNRSIPKALTRNFMGAYEDLKVSLAFDPENIGTLINLGAICDDLGMVDEAIMYLERGIRLTPDNIPLRGNLAFIYQNQGKYDEAIALFSKNIESDSKDAVSMNNRGFCFYKKGDTKSALNDINKSIELYPENSYAYKNRALVYLEMGKKSKACDDLKAASDKGFSISYGNEVDLLLIEHCK